MFWFIHNVIGKNTILYYFLFYHVDVTGFCLFDLFFKCIECNLQCMHQCYCCSQAWEVIGKDFALALCHLANLILETEKAVAELQRYCMIFI